MKPKILFVYMDISAKLGILPYLSSVFSSCLEFDSVFVDQIDLSSVCQYQLILSSSAFCQSRISDTIEPYGIPMYSCRRELNFTYLHKMLEIPALSKVCIVSDQKRNCEAVLTSLMKLGFTQYTYTIYYPGCQPPDASFLHAVTPGEARYVPSTIRNVVDIGNRNVDMATLCYLIKFFELPETILNLVSENYATYLGNFIRHINFQSEDVQRFFIIRDKLLDTMKLGMCVTDSEGRIQMVNQAFCRFLCISRSLVKNQPLTGILESLTPDLSFRQLLESGTIDLKGPKGESLCFFYAGSFESARRSTLFLFLLDGISSWALTASTVWELDEMIKGSRVPYSRDSNLAHLVSQCKRINYVFQTAKAYAKSGFPVMLIGESGLAQPQLARFIHLNSPNAERPFYYIDAGHPFSSQSAGNHVSTISSYEELEALILEGESCTLFLNHLERASAGFQKFLSAVLERKNSRSFFAADENQGVRFVCSFHGDIQSPAIAETFLSELFFQLGTLTVRLPSIREMKEYLPALYRYMFSELFLCSSQNPETMFTGQLMDFLLNYDYPGNLKELENLCRYFYYMFHGKKLTLAQLPSYISCIPGQKPALSSIEREVLETIRLNPHCGRNKIHVLLSAGGTELTPHQIRNLLADLSENAYIRILKTKQGCEITELGEYMLACSDG